MNQEASSNSDTSFFGHPAGLTTLFFTEMWERMSYYGMRALLVLYMSASLQEGGLFFTVAAATAIYGLYTGSVYFMGLPGGWLSDRMFGGQKAVFYGGVIIMIGHIILAVPSNGTFFIGLIFVVLGTGLLKPNIAALVGELYSETDKRRDAGFALYYMGINIGSVLGNIICGWLQVNAGWHWAFGAAAVGMAIGLIQYKRTEPKLKGIGSQPTEPLSPAGRRKTWAAIGAFLAALAIITGLTYNGTIVIDPVKLAQYVAIFFAVVFVIYYSRIYFWGNLTSNEKQRLQALLLICVASICFWSGFEQAGSSMNLFALDFTDRMIGTFEIPTIWFQSANSIFIIALSPFFAALWINIGKRFVSPVFGIKAAIGLIIMASGFLVMFFAAQYAASGLKVAPYWLITTYFLHTVGELCLSPVALSAVSRLSPRRFLGQMMGVFTLTYSIGNIISGLLAGNFDPNNVEQLPSLYMQILVFGVGIGAVVLLIGLYTRKLENLPADDDKFEEKAA
ncbi:peptide MFS transporter [uncultured Pseudoteredinibacter sp.]|uniref:peptide MFS transporter n=1 Tax=uncultured Pseudoteredinibacter sp. TaxID=1641701 RepID=UPI0026357859|nr:peptide MFS transporter [uncultured Pseudoteredinibacter sp.]